MILEYTGVSYDEVRYDNREKWFNEDKPKLSHKNPATTLPYLTDGDKVVSESDAVIIYIVHKAGKPELLGRNADEQVNVATVMGVTRDLHGRYINLVYGRYGDKTFEEAKAAFIEQAKPYLTKLNGLLEGKQFYAGEITWVDFAVAEFVQCLWLLDNGLIESFANVWNQQKRVWDLAEIKKYHGSDRWHERPVNNPQVAKWY